jgi:UDP-N-acetyl-D-glucosamine dehydrogenase
MEEIIKKIKEKKAKIGIIGLGYVGLPLAIEFCSSGFQVIGFDTDKKKVEMLKKGKSYIKHIGEERLKEVSKSLDPTSDFSRLKEVDCIIICVPTPLGKHREPNMTYVFNTGNIIAKYLRKGQLVVLESTTYPGTTDEDLRMILERSGLKAGEDFFLAFSPEREDPGNKQFSTSKIPKIVGGYTKRCLEVAKTLYDQIVVKTVPVSSTKVAEAAKLLENIYRAVNIALVNEMKMLLDKMGIDIWEVIEAAKTKPFGFQAFYPGPGLGGHCIPIDPFYLTWKAKEYELNTRFIELAGEINAYMPYYVIEKAFQVLNLYGKTVKEANILILGVAYKKDVDDQRESPALKIIQLLKKCGANVYYNDPFVPWCGGHRNYPDIDMKSVELTKEVLNSSDLTILVTDHSIYDYHFIEKHSQCILDTRNAFESRGIKSKKIFKA